MITASRPDAPNKPATHRRRRRSRTGPRGGPGNAARATRAPPACQAPARGPRRGPPDAAAPDPSRCGSGSESLLLPCSRSGFPALPPAGDTATPRHVRAREDPGGQGSAPARFRALLHIRIPSLLSESFSIIRVLLYYPGPSLATGFLVLLYYLTRAAAGKAARSATPAPQPRPQPQQVAAAADSRPAGGAVSRLALHQRALPSVRARPPARSLPRRRRPPQPAAADRKSVV